MRVTILPVAAAAVLCATVASAQDTTTTTTAITRTTTTTGAPTTTLIFGSNQSNPLAPVGDFFDKLSATTTSKRPVQSLQQGLLSAIAPDGINLGAAVAGIPVITKFLSNFTGGGGGASPIDPALASTVLQLLSSSASGGGSGTSAAAPNPTVSAIEGLVNELCRFRIPIAQFADVFVSLITMNPAVSFRLLSRERGREREKERKRESV